MIERADSDNDGLVTFEDFYNIMTKKTFAWGGFTFRIESFMSNYSFFIKHNYLINYFKLHYFKN